MTTLDDLPVVATAKTPRLSAAERERAADWARSQGIRAASIEYHLRSSLRFFSLADVQRMWFEEQAKLKEEERQAEESAAYRLHIYGTV